MVLKTACLKAGVSTLFTDNDTLSPLRRILGKMIAALGTDPNRRLSEIIGGVPDVSVEHDGPGLLRGQYRIVVLHKLD